MPPSPSAVDRVGHLLDCACKSILASVLVDARGDGGGGVAQDLRKVQVSTPASSPRGAKQGRRPCSVSRGSSARLTAAANAFETPSGDKGRPISSAKTLPSSAYAEPAASRSRAWAAL